MKSNTFDIIPLFSRPLLVDTLPPHLSKITSFLDTQEIRKEPTNEEGLREYGLRSKNSYILNLPECKPLSDHIFSLAKHFGVQVLNHDYENYKFSQSWISIKNPGQYHRAHTHPNSLISGVFYYGSFSDDTPAIGFTSEEPNRNLQPSYKNNQNPFLADELLVAKPGLLYMFPSHYVHYVPENKTNLSRKSLSFNIVPINGLGAEDNLTELKF